jgi:alkaline phosphatase
MRCLQLYFAFCLLLSASVIADSDITFPSIKNTDSWYQQGNDWLQNKLISQQLENSDRNQPLAKNVILFVGDGMSITTLTASRIWQGQQQGLLGEEHFLHFEYFPHTALIKTYNTNQQTPDSAGTMSAMMTGVKTRAGLISMGTEQELSDCKGSERYQKETLLEWGHKQGFDTGVVTTARLTHATPAATYAHSPDRGWEGDYDRHPNAYWYGCDSIAKQLIKTAFPAGLDLALGGGSSKLESYYPDFKQQFPHGRLLTDNQSLQALDFTSASNSNAQVGPILGVFSAGHLSYELDRNNKNSAQQPSLQQMTKKAIQYFQQRNGNYLLVIEGARIDHAHHKGNAARALSETSSLANAVKLADEMTADEDTLIIVTADHSHTFTMAGYPKRGNPILGISKNQKNETVLANDGLPYTTLGYANGKAYGRQIKKADDVVDGLLVDSELADSERIDFQQGVAVPLIFETHGSDDVALHAKGPSAYLFSGLMEQNEIFHTILQALTKKDAPQQLTSGESL